MVADTKRKTNNGCEALGLETLQSVKEGGSLRSPPFLGHLPTRTAGSNFSFSSTVPSRFFFPAYCLFFSFPALLPLSLSFLFVCLRVEGFDVSPRFRKGLQARLTLAPCGGCSFSHPLVSCAPARYSRISLRAPRGCVSGARRWWVFPRNSCCPAVQNEIPARELK